MYRLKVNGNATNYPINTAPSYWYRLCECCVRQARKRW